MPPSRLAVIVRRATAARVFVGGCLAACALLVAAGASAQRGNGPTALPLPPMKPTSDTYFGTVVDDPYRALESKDDPAVVAWMRAQNDHARRVLGAIPGRGRLLADLTRFDEAVGGRTGQVTRLPGDRWFVERRGVQDNQYKVIVRDGLADGKERVVVDPDALEASTGTPHAVNWFEPSPDGRRIAYGLSKGGSEEAVLHLADVGSGRPIGAPIARADFGGVDWTRDGRLVVFNRLQPMRPGMAATERYQDSRVHLLRVGEPVERARVVLGRGMPGVEIAPTEIPFVRFTSDGRWALGYVFDGTNRDLRLYVSPLRRLLAGRPQWRAVVATADGVTGIVYHADTLYLVTHRGAPRSKLVAMDLAGPDRGRTRDVVPASDRVVIAAAAAADGLYVETREGNVNRLYAMPWGAAEPKPVPLPVEGSFSLTGSENFWSAGDPRLPGVVLRLQGWTQAAQIYLVSAADGARNTGLQPKGPYDAPADIVATEVQVRSHDGAMVPMSIIHKKGVVLDGRNPTVLYGYASYGFTEEPYFSTNRLAWLEAGGVWAVANPRGSSVYGEDWYRAGFQGTKRNTWLDFIACAEYLVAQKWTSPARLGILGGSAGGILVGRALTERPDLFAAVVPAVGVLDTVRAETTPNGVPNIPEFGTVQNEAGFRALLEMSTYAHIKAGTAYPAVLLTHGVNDPRVEVWMSSKAAARLQASTTSGRPVLLRLDWDAGHGVGNTKRQRLEESADVYAFFLWQMGVPGFQP